MKEQEAKEIVRMLIKGSAEIDRMKKEINCIVTSVLGLANSLCNWRTGESVKSIINPLDISNENKLAWEVSFAEGNLTASFLLIPSDSSLTPYVFCTWSNSWRRIEPTGIEMNHVQTIHSNLHDFIDLMERYFPQLNKKWQPLLDAAKTAEAVENK